MAEAKPVMESGKDSHFEELVLRKTLDAAGRLKAGMSTSEMHEEYERFKQDRADLDAARAEQQKARLERSLAEAEELRKEREAEEVVRRSAIARSKLSSAGIDPAKMSDQEAMSAWEMEHARRADQHRKEQAQRMADHNFNQSGCPARHTQNLSSINPEGKWASVSADLLRDYSDGFLYALLGVRGNGKTQMAVWIIRHVCDAGGDARYVKALDLFREIRATFRKDAEITEENLIQKYATVDLLVIDEAHQRGNSEFEQNTLINLIDRRYDAMLATILIANQTKAEFAASIGDSVVSRIHEAGKAIVCDWPSYRKPGTRDAK